MKICPKLCNECPFSNTSMKGFLSNYSINDFILFQSKDILFPCHMLVPYDMTIDEAKTLIIEDKLPICRGYIESMRKSCKIPKNPEFALLVKNVELSDNSMSIFEFATYHKIINEDT